MKELSEVEARKLIDQVAPEITTKKIQMFQNNYNVRYVFRFREVEKEEEEEDEEEEGGSTSDDHHRNPKIKFIKIENDCDEMQFRIHRRIMRKSCSYLMKIEKNQTFPCGDFKWNVSISHSAGVNLYNFKHHLDRDQLRLSTGAFFTFVHDVFHGLNFLHHQVGITHNDVNATNMTLDDSDGFWKFIDFGASSILYERPPTLFDHTAFPDHTIKPMIRRYCKVMKEIDRLGQLNSNDHKLNAKIQLLHKDAIVNDRFRTVRTIMYMIDFDYYFTGTVLEFVQNYFGDHHNEKSPIVSLITTLHAFETSVVKEYNDKHDQNYLKLDSLWMNIGLQIIKSILSKEIEIRRA